MTKILTELDIIFPMDDHLTPILMVHGIDDTGARFRNLKNHLQKKGFNHLETMDIVPPDGSLPIEEMAFQVAKKVESILSTLHSIQLDIVAYSMGTLVVRHFIQMMGGDRRIRRFVSIAGPHHGTLTAYLRQNTACRQMRPGSDFLKKLNQDRNWLQKVRVYSFLTLFDLMIFPCITSILPGATNRLFFSPIHPLTVSDPWVMDGVVRALRHE